MQEREVNVCFIYGDMSIEEVTCSANEFNTKHSHKLKDKNVVGYIKEFCDTQNIKFFIKQCNKEVFDYFRINELNYYTGKTWKFKEVKKETLDQYINYLTVMDGQSPGARKFILKAISMEL